MKRGMGLPLLGYAFICRVDPSAAHMNIIVFTWAVQNNVSD
jgi:hypothetical protein